MTLTILKQKTPDRHEFFAEFKSKWRVENLMTQDVMALHFDDKLNLIDATLDWRKFRHLPVIDDQRHLKGMISHRDLMNEFASSTSDPAKHKKYSEIEKVGVKDVMIWNVETTTPAESLATAAKKMYENKYGCLPVLDMDKKLVGILTEADFVKLIHFGEKALFTAS